MWSTLLIMHIFFILFISIFFSHIIRNLNPLDSDQSSRQIDICLAIIQSVYMCMSAFFLFQKKKVSVNIIWWESLVCVCGYDGLCLFSLSLCVCLSVSAIINCWNTQMSIGMCTREYWSKKSDAFDVTNLIWIKIETNTSFFSWDKKP
jgi:hypothetical protein